MYRAVRGLATKAANHAPPIKIYGVHGKYAEATYVAASKAGVLDKVSNELNAFRGILAKSPAFATYLENPAVAAGEKEKIMMDMMPAKEFSDITRNLMSVVSANGRVSDTNKIIGAYEELMQASKGQVSAVIISAEALDKATLAKATKAVTGMLTSGQTANVTTEVNPDIMGGLQVKIGDKFMDLSVSSRIIDVEKVLQSSA